MREGGMLFSSHIYTGGISRMKKRGVEPRSTQTKVKHTILEKYLKAWGGIIVNGLRGDQVKDVHFIYIDCNASFGRYNGELEDSVINREAQTIWGSPIIGVKALDGHAAWITKDRGIN